ncbi:CPBP family intramembrane glutamic endopeptidase [Haloferax mediterranei]|uniref:CPBP family intramembrane glutamic endopeptidase n=1 Tax=Haloferax mediterranei TaxID=2252 RepID=UPI001EF9FCA7|nr:type II CAAX endopeptidase family protein [Haloferax mediterranei]
MRGRIEPPKRLQALLGAVGIAVGGALSSFVVFMLFRPAVSGVLQPSFPALSTLLITKGAQVGFALFVVSYLGLTRQWDEYVHLRRPTVHDAVWVVIGSIGLDIMVAVSKLVLPVFGLSLGVLSGAGADGMDVGLATWPVIWPVIFGGLYLFPALLEEQFFRGLVQGRLRDSFHPVSAVVLGAGLFALVHGLYGIAGGPEFLATYLIHLFGQGLVFCLVYERTDNLLIVALVHAISWTNSGFPFFGLL